METRTDTQPSDSSIKKDILLSELNSCYIAINTYITNQSKIINFSSAIFAALIALGYSGLELNFLKVFLILPYLLITINAYLAYNLIRSYIVQGYRKYLEYQLNIINNQNLIFFSRLVKKHLLSGSKIALMPILINVLIMIYVLVECYSIADSTLQKIAFVWFPGVLSLLLITLTLKNLHIYEDAFDTSLIYSQEKIFDKF